MGKRPRRTDYADDPLDYIEEILRVELTPKQIEVVQKLRTPPYKVLVRAGHSVGKSFLASCLLSWHYDSFPESYSILTAPTQQSVQDVVFAELRRRRRGDLKLMPKAATLFDNESHWLKGFTASRGEAFSGRHLKHMMFQYDEATALGKDYFDSGRSMFSGTADMGWICWYNPIDISSQVFEEESAGGWHLVTMSQLDHPNVLAELEGRDPPYPGAVRLAQVIENMDAYCDGRIRVGSEPQENEVFLLRPGETQETCQLRWLPTPDADSRVLGRWPTQSGSTVWSDGLWRKVEATRIELNPHWKVWIGCDVAFYGDDQTVFVVKQGPCIVHIERHSGWGPKRSCERLKELCERFKGDAKHPHSGGNPKRIRCLIDSGGGYGTGIVDYADGHDFQPCNSQWPAKNEEKYHNLRSELWFMTREHAEAGMLDVSRIPNNERQRLRAELFSATYAPDTMDRWTVCPKPEMIERLKRSPDMADSLNLAVMAHHL